MLLGASLEVEGEQLRNDEDLDLRMGFWIRVQLKTSSCFTIPYFSIPILGSLPCLPKNRHRFLVCSVSPSKVKPVNALYNCPYLILTMQDISEYINSDLAQIFTSLNLRSQAVIPHGCWWLLGKRPSARGKPHFDLYKQTSLVVASSPKSNHPRPSYHNHHHSVTFDTFHFKTPRSPGWEREYSSHVLENQLGHFFGERPKGMLLRPVNEHLKRMFFLGSSW